MRIAITSGKGGTGKTTVSTGLLHVFTMYSNYDVQLVDCDVEEPDCHIFIKSNITASYPVIISMPNIDPGKCTFCGKCKRVCSFNAIVMLPAIKFIEVNEDMCHGCGACSYVCPEGAITEDNKIIGRVSCCDSQGKNDFIEGRMNVGNVLQTRVIRETIKHARKDGVVLFDSPPGTSCPVIAAASQSDYVLMVTEPTPFGLYDLRLMTETVKQLGKKHGIVINKSGLNYKPLYEFISQNKIPLLGEIPFKKEYAMAYSRGEVLPEYDKGLKDTYIGIINSILDGQTL
ncbi:MAG: ATP-binding protein [Bacteroidales bacterium]